MRNNIVPLKQPEKRFFLQRDYALGYLALSIGSQEEEVLGAAFRQAIRSFGGAGRSLLDIGCADGRLTARVAQFFKRLTVFEPNPTLFNHAMARLSRRHQFDGRNSTFPPDHRLLPETYDTAIASHVLYHIERSDWPSFFQAIAQSLRPGGVCITVLWNNLSDAKKYASRTDPTRWLCTSEDLLADRDSLASAGFEIVDLRQFDPVIRAYTTEAARDVTAFLLGPTRPEAPEALALAAEVEQTLLSGGLNNSQTAITVRKR